MPRRLIILGCFLSLVLPAIVPVQAQQPKVDSDAAISQSLQAIEQEWAERREESRCGGIRQNRGR